MAVSRTSRPLLSRPSTRTLQRAHAETLSILTESLPHLRSGLSQESAECVAALVLDRLPVQAVAIVNTEQVLAFYQSASVSVLSSVNRTVHGDAVALPELLGFTAMEAMACGTPVVVSRVAGMHHVVDDGVTGYLVPPSDPEALRDRLRRLLGDPGLARSMGTAARRRIEELFTWDVVAQRCLEAYGL